MNETYNTREQVESFCCRIGSDPLLVQGSGGNISWKDGNLLWIKASGTRLADAGRDDIFIPLDLKHLQAAIEAGDFSVKPQVLDDMQMRPSIETFLHALMPQNVVVHLHAVEILAHLVKGDFERIFVEKLDSDISWASVSYRKPGVELAQAVNKTLAGSLDVNVVFLQNHGVVIGGQNIHTVEQLLNRLVKCLQIPVQQPLSVWIDDNHACMAAMAGYTTIIDDEIQQLARDVSMFNRLPDVWALYPDHVVFLGPMPNCYPNKDALFDDVSRPELAFVQGDGVYVNEYFNNAKGEQLRCYYEVLVRQQEMTSLSVLSTAQVAELVDWDAEKYRMQLIR